VQWQLISAVIPQGAVSRLAVNPRTSTVDENPANPRAAAELKRAVEQIFAQTGIAARTIPALSPLPNARVAIMIPFEWPDRLAIPKMSAKNRNRSMTPDDESALEKAWTPY
jgi:hypothetical protein